MKKIYTVQDLGERFGGKLVALQSSPAPPTIKGAVLKEPQRGARIRDTVGSRAHGWSWDPGEGFSTSNPSWLQGPADFQGLKIHLWPRHSPPLLIPIDWFLGYRVKRPCEKDKGSFGLDLVSPIPQSWASALWAGLLCFYIWQPQSLGHTQAKARGRKRK